MPQPHNAQRIRPNMPDYGITNTPTDGMLTWDWLDAQLTTARNYWVCTTRPDGRPHAVPVWAIWMDNTLFFSSGKTAIKAQNIAHNPHVVVHLESGDDTVICEGTLLTLAPTDPRKPALFKAYAQKYNFNPADNDDPTISDWYELQFAKIMTWRESDFLDSVAYWIFDV